MIRRTLVAYYSYSGNTRALAEIVGSIVAGELHEIVPVAAYPKAYPGVLDQG